MKSSVGRKILMLLSVTIMVLVITICIAIYTFSKDFIKAEVIKNEQFSVQQITTESLDLFYKIEEFILELSYMEVSSESDLDISDTYHRVKEEYERTREVAELIVSHNFNDVVTSIVIYNNQDYQLFWGSGVLDESKNIEEYEWYQSLKENDKMNLIYGPVIEDYKPENVKKEEVLLYLKKRSYVNMTEDDEIPFILVALDYDVFEETFQRLLTTELRGVYVTDQQGFVLYEKNIAEDMLTVLREIRSGQGETLNDEIMCVESGQYFYTTVNVPELGFSITTVDHTNVLFTGVNVIIIKSIIIVLTLGTICAGVATYLLKKVMLPLGELNEFISTMEMDRDSYIQIRGNDELVQIRKQFNLMKKRINDANEKIYMEKVKSTQAQIAVLQAQINPHFIYNTLDSICSIAKIMEIDPIIDLTHSLSNMMRYTITNQENYSDIREELEHVRAYVQIINIRYEDSLDLIVDVPEKFYKKKVPKLILQPIVENAWTHGISKKPSLKGTVRINMVEAEDCLELSVVDDGVGLSDSDVERLEHHLLLDGNEISLEESGHAGNNVAIKNVHERLMLLSEYSYGLEIERNEQNGCTVRLRIVK